MPRVSTSAKKLSIHGAVSAASPWLCSVALWISRSSTSVRFMTWVTRGKLRSSHRRKTSSKRKVRKFPMWARFQTVGPQV